MSVAGCRCEHLVYRARRPRVVVEGESFPAPHVFEKIYSQPVHETSFSARPNATPVFRAQIRGCASL